MSSPLKEFGTLPVGVEVDGVVHRDFVLRPRLVRDSVYVMADPRAVTDDSYRGVALFACQLERLGSLAKEQITADLLLDMFDMDMEEIMEANKRLGVKLRTFRNPGAGSTQAAPGAAEDRGSVEGSAGTQ